MIVQSNVIKESLDENSDISNQVFGKASSFWQGDTALPGSFLSSSAMTGRQGTPFEGSKVNPHCFAQPGPATAHRDKEIPKRSK